MVYKFFDKMSASLVDKSTKGSGVTEQLAEELPKLVIKNFKKQQFILHLKTTWLI